jgi:phage-related protein
VRTIEFYKTSSGRSPVEEFLDSLSDQQTRKIAWVLRLIERLDVVPVQYFKKLSGTDDIWEIWVQVGGNIFRLLGFFHESSVVVLTHGFAKKSQKTPIKEIELAEQRKRDYLQRKNS